MYFLKELPINLTNKRLAYGQTLGYFSGTIPLGDVAEMSRNLRDNIVFEGEKAHFLNFFLLLLLFLLYNQRIILFKVLIVENSNHQGTFFKFFYFKILGEQDLSGRSASLLLALCALLLDMID